MLGDFHVRGQQMIGILTGGSFIMDYGLNLEEAMFEMS